MLTILFILGCSCGLSLFLTPLAREAARRFGLVDYPDRRRKVHREAIPAAGGIPILLSVCLALGAALVLPSQFRDQLADQGPLLAGLLLAAGLICLVGVGDDLGVLRIRHKLLGQLLAVGIVVGSGLVVRSIQIFGYQIDLGLLAVPFTMFWLLGAINSLNLIDGMDGLLSSVGLIVCVAIAAMAFLGGQWTATFVAVALAGALLGFLRYNLPPASIFLGDSGSMLIGLVVGVLAIRSSLKGPATVALAAPVVVLTVPILDTMAAIIRRKLTGRSVYSTDRGHLHHCLQRHGFSNQRVLLWVGCLCLLTAAGALASLAFSNELLALVTGLAVTGILIATRLFGYAEFLLVKNRLMATAASLVQPRANGKERRTEVRLQGTIDWRQLWEGLTACAAQLHLKGVRLDVNAPALHEGYHARWDCSNDDGEQVGVWRVELPLTAWEQCVGRLTVIGTADREPVAAKIAALSKWVEQFEQALPSLAEAAVSRAAVPA